ncbi:MAG: hypothetical protein WCO77_09015 [bacterium]
MENEVQDATTIVFAAWLFLMAMVYLSWRLPRRFAMMPLLITTCYMSMGQMIVVGGLHFQLYRILMIVGLLRVWVRGEQKGEGFGGLDKLFVAWVLVTVLIGTATQPSLDRFLNRSGEVYNAVGTYFLVRCWIRNLDDVVAVVRVAGYMIAPLALSMIVEKTTGRNIFSVFGGVPEITEVRDGKLRCQGAFRHPLLAGTYFATLFPLFVGLWFQPGRSRWPAVMGGGSAIVATVASGSSGAFLTLLVAGIGFALWPFRDRMRLLRWSMLILLLLLAAFMQAPVWYLFTRISDVAGGSGWYRSYLIDQALEHWNEWWLVGSTYTAHWAPGGEVMPGNPGNMDILNQFVAEGLGGGVLKLGLFVAIIVAGFKIVGRITGQKGRYPFPHEVFVWSIGVCLAAHCISFMSVTYFDQIIVMWYLLLGILTMLACTSAREDSVSGKGAPRDAVDESVSLKCP